MEKDKITNYLSFIILLTFGLWCFISFITLGLKTGEWFGHWTFEPMIFLIFFGSIFLLVSATYFLDIVANYKWPKIVRIVITTLVLIFIFGFMIVNILFIS